MKEDKEKKDALESFISESTRKPPMDGPIVDENQGRNEYGDSLNYITVDLSVLPAGIFYKPGTIVMIRAASVVEIQAYSTIDDKNYLDVTEKMNEMLSRCIRIKFPNGMIGTYKDLKDSDRLFLIFMIRELTFQKNSNLAKDVKCDNCKSEFKIQFRSTPGKDSPKTFVNFEMDKDLEPYFNKQDRTFDIPIGSKMYKLAPPSIGIQEVFFKNIKDNVQAEKTPNVAFLKIFPFTLWDRKTISEDGIKVKEEEFKNMEDIDTFLDLDESVSKMMFGVKELKMNCPSCGEEVHADMTFPKGASVSSREAQAYLTKDLRSKLEDIEKTIFTVFTVSWETLTDNKFEFMNQMRVPTNVIDNWPYYEFEKYIKKLNEKNENEKKHQEDQEHEQHQNIPNMGNMSSLAKSFNPSNFKLPNFKSPF